MPNCESCGSFVTERYVRVFSRNEADTVRACPYCEDMVREGGKAREARGHRKTRRSNAG